MAIATAFVAVPAFHDVQHLGRLAPPADTEVLAAVRRRLRGVAGEDTASLPGRAAARRGAVVGRQKPVLHALSVSSQLVAAYPVAALAPVALGLVRPEFGFSYGYAGAAVLLGARMLASANTLVTSPLAWWLSLGVLVHGARLFLLYLLRDFTVEGMIGGVLARSPRGAASETAAADDGMPGVRRVLQPLVAGAALGLLVLGLSVPAISACCLVPTGRWSYPGVVLQWVGVILSAAADVQKFSAKRRDPSRWVQTGLYSAIRHPNYTGELCVWAGIFLAGLPALASSGGVASAAATVLATIAFMAMAATVLRAAKSLDRRQEASYTLQGKDSASFKRSVMYRVYANRTKSMCPWY
eukprot:TRINITY_DN36453_c0_g1_i1.p1 TRINITY_DN36453_c0_g1~~TRINITY_DN36453_c0_g1_i1.p1  ORF type:complete len:355 (+),score=48.42 TRINITY_DN36453_c0_g1_i1:136-1200(+)